MDKKIMYLDMDGVLTDFDAAVAMCSPGLRAAYVGEYDNIPGLFGIMPPLPGAVSAYGALAEVFDVYLLSTAPWDNPSAWSDKVEWINRYLPPSARKRPILSAHKHLNVGDYLVDDRPHKNGAERFSGTVIHFGSDEYPNWQIALPKILQL